MSKCQELMLWSKRDLDVFLTRAVRDNLSALFEHAGNVASPPFLTCKFRVPCGIVRAMESLQDILSHYSAPEDPEMLALKRYVDEHYHTPISVAIHGSVLVATVPSAALASTLRLQTTKIQEA